LKELGAEPLVHVPYVQDYQGDVLSMAKECVGVVIMVAHEIYKTIGLEQLKAAMYKPVMVDGRHVFHADQAIAQGWIFRGIGV